jgi:hypothetical protein
MNISIDEEGTRRINGLSFREFMDHFHGKKILNKRGYEVPKYLLFWQGISPMKIKEHFTFVNRK